MATVKKTAPAQTITDKDLYTLQELKSRLGLSTWAIWRARWCGLRVHKISSRRLVLGRDFIAYLEGRHR